MLAEDMYDWGVRLQCPICHEWTDAKMDDSKGHFETDCHRCNAHLAWGIEQDIAKGTFKGTAVSE